MGRQVDLIASEAGVHWIEFGWNSNELANFSMKAWITHYGTRAMDWVQSLSLGFVSFMGGDLWVHNSTNVPRGNFYGNQKEMKVGIVANQDSNVLKLLDSMGIHSDSQWEVESITIPKTLNYPDGMYSRIPAQRFKRREGVLQAEFLRNMKTSSGTISAIEAIKGETLKGNSALIILKNTSTDEAKLFKVNLNMTKIR